MSNAPGQVEEIIRTIEAEAERLRGEGKDEMPDAEMTAATAGFTFGMVVGAAQALSVLQAKLAETMAKLEEVEKYLKGDCFWDPVVGLENKLVERIQHVEHTLAFDYVTSSALDDVREEIVGEARRGARDELEWELSDKADGYQVSELESRIGDIEASVSSLEAQVESLGESSNA